MWHEEMSILFSVIEREERILELLVDRAQLHYRAYRRRLDKKGTQRIEPDEVVVTILDAAANKPRTIRRFPFRNSLQAPPSFMCWKSCKTVTAR